MCLPYSREAPSPFFDAVQLAGENVEQRTPPCQFVGGTEVGQFATVGNIKNDAVKNNAGVHSSFFLRPTPLHKNKKCKEKGFKPQTSPAM
jgi:hypothetical protein